MCSWLVRHPSASAQQQALTHNYLLAQSSADPEVLLEQVNAHIEAGNFDQALAVANRISDPGYQSWCIVNYCRCLCRSQEILTKRLAVANRISDPLWPILGVEGIT